MQLGRVVEIVIIGHVLDPPDEPTGDLVLMSSSAGYLTRLPARTKRRPASGRRDWLSTATELAAADADYASGNTISVNLVDQPPIRWGGPGLLQADKMFRMRKPVTLLLWGKVTGFLCF